METQEGSSHEVSKGLSTPELMDALREARKIEPELQARGLAFARNVLSGVEDFPISQLNKCKVRIELNDQGGVLVINVPMNKVGAEDSIVKGHNRQLAVKSRFESLPEVARVDVVGSMNSGIVSLNVTLRSDQVPAQYLSQKAVEEVREDVGDSSLNAIQQ